jgi:Zn-dependent metalloprotease
LAVHTDAQGRVRSVQGSVRPQVRIETTPVLTAAEAIRVAKGAVGPATLRGEPAARLGILVLADGARLAYRVEIPTFQPADWRVEVDARDGAVLQKRDLLMHAAGEGVVVDENLLTTPDPVSRPFADLDGSGLLKGAFADVWSFGKLERDTNDQCLLYRTRLSKAKDLRFMARPGDPRFDEQMLYYQVNRAHDYFRRTFGFTGRDHALKVTAHVPSTDAENCRSQGPMDNAYYSPSTDGLYFGDGTGALSVGTIRLGGLNPTSRDADVICHEYTHAVMGRIVPNLSGKAEDLGNALQEGYADYFACTINNGPEMGEYTADDPKGMRNLENSHRYPDDVDDPGTGEPERHWTGMIWGGACWDLRQALGAAVADQVIFHSMYYLPNDGSATFETAAEGLLAADAELYGSAHREVIRQVMSRRGILNSEGS